MADEEDSVVIPCRASVVVPVRNGARVIRRQLDALAAQTIVDHLEIIVIDDASSDGTASVVDAWHAEHPGALTLIRRTSSGGPNASRNDGIRAATAPVVLLCDGDDVVAPDWAERLVAAIDLHPTEQVMVTGRCVALDPDDHLTDETIVGEATLRGVPYMLGGNGGLRRDLAILVGGFDEQIRAGGTEVDFSFRALDRGARVVYVPEAVIGYRMPTGITGVMARELRRSRGRAYLGRRHGARAGFDRPYQLFVVPWKRVVLTLLGRTTDRNFLKDLASAVGLTFWGACFLCRTPPPRPGL